MKKIGILLVTGLLSGCAALDWFELPQEHEENQRSMAVQAQGSIVQASQPFNPKPVSENSSVYQGIRMHKPLADYAAQMVIAMLDQGPELTGKPVAVASFVDFDQQLNTPSMLGNQFAEASITMLRKYGVNVQDLQVSPVIETQGAGNFAFARVAGKQQVDYVLAGTLVYAQQGVEIQGRIVQPASGMVIATSRVFIPYQVLKSQGLLPAR